MRGVGGSVFDDGGLTRTSNVLFYPTELHDAQDAVEQKDAELSEAAGDALDMFNEEVGP